MPTSTNTKQRKLIAAFLKLGYIRDFTAPLHKNRKTGAITQHIRFYHKAIPNLFYYIRGSSVRAGYNEALTYVIPPELKAHILSQIKPYEHISFYQELVSIPRREELPPLINEQFQTAKPPSLIELAHSAHINRRRF